MIFKNSKERLDEWANKKPGWYKWFAWYPVYFDDEQHLVWLQLTERKRRIGTKHSLGASYSAKCYDYRLIYNKERT